MKLKIVDQQKFKNAISFLIAVPFMMSLGLTFGVLFAKGYLTVIY